MECIIRVRAHFHLACALQSLPDWKIGALRMTQKVRGGGGCWNEMRDAPKLKGPGEAAGGDIRSWPVGEVRLIWRTSQDQEPPAES